EGGALEPLDRFFPGLHLPHPEAGDQLLRLSEWAIGNGSLAAVEFHPRALGAGLQSLAREHDAGFHELFVELAHLFENLLARKNTGLGLSARLDNHHESHRYSHWVRLTRRIITPSAVLRAQKRDELRPSPPWRRECAQRCRSPRRGSPR